MITIKKAKIEDSEEILSLHKFAYESEAKLYNDWSLPALTQSIESLKQEFTDSVVIKAMLREKIVGSVRARAIGETCEIGRLIVHPGSQKQGIGSSLLKAIENEYIHLNKYELFTGSISVANIRLYERHGYTITYTKPISDTVSITYLEKHVPNNL